MTMFWIVVFFFVGLFVGVCWGVTSEKSQQTKAVCKEFKQEIVDKLKIDEGFTFMVAVNKYKIEEVGEDIDPADQWKFN